MVIVLTLTTDSTRNTEGKISWIMDHRGQRIMARNNANRETWRIWILTINVSATFYALNLFQSCLLKHDVTGHVKNPVYIASVTCLFPESLYSHPIWSSVMHATNIPPQFIEHSWFISTNINSSLQAFKCSFVMHIWVNLYILISTVKLPDTAGSEWGCQHVVPKKRTILLQPNSVQQLDLTVHFHLVINKQLCCSVVLCCDKEGYSNNAYKFTFIHLCLLSKLFKCEAEFSACRTL